MNILPASNMSGSGLLLLSMCLNSSFRNFDEASSNHIWKTNQCSNSWRVNLSFGHLLCHGHGFIFKHWLAYWPLNTYTSFKHDHCQMCLPILPAQLLCATLFFFRHKSALGETENSCSQNIWRYLKRIATFFIAFKTCSRICIIV